MNEPDILLSHGQALRIMALSVMLKDGNLAIRGDDREDVDAALTALSDAGEEIALQVAGYPTSA